MTIICNDGKLFVYRFFQIVNNKYPIEFTNEKLNGQSFFWSQIMLKQWSDAVITIGIIRGIGVTTPPPIAYENIKIRMSNTLENWDFPWIVLFLKRSVIVLEFQESSFRFLKC